LVGFYEVQYPLVLVCKVKFYFNSFFLIVKQHGGVLPWAAMPLTAGNDRKKAAALISQNRHQ
jgi:hypothetical protein